MDIGILALGTIGAVVSGWWFVRSVQATIAEEDQFNQQPVRQVQPVPTRGAVVTAVDRRSSTTVA